MWSFISSFFTTTSKTLAVSNWLCDDIIFTIMTFLEQEFIIGTCSLISKQFRTQAQLIPIEKTCSALTRSKSLEAMKKVGVSFNLTDLSILSFTFKECEWIANCPKMVNLKRLSLYGDVKEGDNCCRVLSESPYLKNLNCLELDFNFGNEGCNSIAGFSSEYLHTLSLSNGSFNNDGLNLIISKMNHLTSLKLVQIENVTVEDCNLFNNPKLKRLDVGLCNFQSILIGQSSKLESLELFNGFLHSNSNISNLKQLSIETDLISLVGVDHKFSDQHCMVFKNNNQVTDLNVQLSQVGDEGLKVIALFMKLHRLNLWGTKIGDAGLKSLADSSNMSLLEYLNLENTVIHPEGIQALCSSPYLTNLKFLNLDRCKLGDKGVEYIANGSSMTRLTELFLSKNGIGPTGCIYIANSQFLKKLKNLDLSRNSIGEEGLEFLANSSNMESVMNLDISERYNTKKECEIITNSPYFNLNTICICNSIGSDGFQMLEERGIDVDFLEDDDFYP